MGILARQLAHKVLCVCLSPPKGWDSRRRTSPPPPGKGRSWVSALWASHFSRQCFLLSCLHSPAVGFLYLNAQHCPCSQARELCFSQELQESGVCVLGGVLMEINMTVELSNLSLGCHWTKQGEVMGNRRWWWWWILCYKQARYFSPSKA